MTARSPVRALAGGLALLAAAGVAGAQVAVKPALVWSAAVEPDEGFKFGFNTSLALHPDGTALLSIDQDRERGGDTVHRLLLLGVSPEGRVMARTTPHPERRHYIRGAKLTRDGEGFALFTNRGEPDEILVYRLARDGSVRAAQPFRLRGDSINEISGIAADGRGGVIAYGGGFDGPHTPALAMLDRNGRVVWSFFGKHAMPPGGVRAVRFRRDGASDALVIDREKPYWERRSAKGALLMRAAMQFGGACWDFLDERRVAHVFYNWETQPGVNAPAKRWVLGVHGENGRLLPGHFALDLPAGESAHCRLAVNDAGWIAAALDAPRIGLFDFALARRAEIDLSAQIATAMDVLAVDGTGGVTALVETGPRDQPGRKLVLLRFAPPAR